mgnify:CR=1 FL=1|jgi:hypothetical protein
MSLSVFFIECWVFSMLHLPSLIGATPETRLVLLAWVAFHQCSGGTTTVIPFEGLGLSKRQLSAALEYLVRTEFVWKIRNFSSQTAKGRSQHRFDYGLSTKYFEETGGSLSNNQWWLGEVLHVLTCLNLTSKIVDEKSLTITPAMRLVWAVLVSHADQAGYAIGLDSLMLGRMLGMNGRGLNASLQSLHKAGCISIKTNGASRSPISGPIEPIYKIIPHNPAQKDILVGVLGVDDFIIRSNFLSSLSDYYNKVSKQKSTNMRNTKKKAITTKSHYPASKSELSDENFYTLSKFICTNKLIPSLHHIIWSIIFKHIASFAHVRFANLSESMPLESKRELYEVLKLGVQRELIQALMIATPKELQDSFEQRLVGDNLVTNLQEYLVYKLTYEISYKINEISRLWRPFLAWFVGEVMIIDCKAQDMVLLNPTLTGEAGLGYSLRTSFALKVRVPNTQLFTDCIVDGAKLWTDNSRVAGPLVGYCKRIVAC